MDSSDILRFQKKIIQGAENECWPFNGKGDSFGYGRMRVGGKQIRAHRISYTVFIGEIPNGMCVLHRCDNPICVNPNHLVLGTHLDNHKDMVQKNRHCVPNRKFKKGHSGFCGEKNGKSKLTVEQVLEIRDKYIPYKYSAQKLAKEYGITREAIREVVSGRTWRF